MHEETFTQLGYRAFGFELCFLALLVILIPISWKSSRRAFPVNILLALVVILCAMLPMPGSYLMVISFFCAMVGAGTTFVIRKGRQNFIALAFMPAVMFPIVVPAIIISRISQKDITLQKDTVEVVTQFKTASFRKDLLDVTYKKALFRRGYYWDFDEADGKGFVVSSSDSFWTDQGFADGDEIARRIITWAGARPRQLVLREGQKWPDVQKWQDPRKPSSSTP